MHDRHHRLAGVALLLAAFASPVPGKASGPEQCARIGNVAVPYEVGIDGERLSFTGRNRRVEVIGDAVIVDGVRMTHGDATYHADLRRFLAEAETARDARPLRALLRGRGAELAETATRMCAAILALAESSRRVETALPGFRSPVRIRLK